MNYSSKDFHRTKKTIEVEYPEKLTHEQVLKSAKNHDFESERGHQVGIVDLPSKTISMTIGGLTPGQATNRHRHSYETLIYVTKGSGYSEIGDKKILWKQGDAIYVPIWSWHRHVNDSSYQDVEYIACENTPLLQNLGGLALREEAAPEEPSWN